MNYVISDLHGYPIEKLKNLLEKAAFGADDFLYVLGDVVDRNGDGGIGVLLWLMEQLNVQLILGNHESMLLSCDFVFDERGEDGFAALDGKKRELLENYTLSGGDVTLNALRQLPHEMQRAILGYLRRCPLYKTLCIGAKGFILVHSGLDNFSKEKRICDYSSDELLWAWPELTDEYYDDIHTVFGHTPTMSYGQKYKGKIIHTRTWTNIDCGTGFGNEPILLRLEDYAEFALR
ncbi:MAG: metallophosphoesterase [Oscillospiraceae bacterium]|nr:metallophosphoesterase [Oscillospiraceae bacterium]